MRSGCVVEDLLQQVQWALNYCSLEFVLFDEVCYERGKSTSRVDVEAPETPVSDAVRCFLEATFKHS